MPYIPDWERLGAAVKLITGSGIDETEAKVELCHAIADRKIQLRVRVAGLNGVFPDANIRVPARLEPDGIDWVRSRPIAKWWIGPKPGQHYEWDGKDEQIALLEVSAADIRTIFLSEAEKPGTESAESPKLDEDGVKRLFECLIRENPEITQRDVEKIARDRGANVDREKIRTIYRSVGGSTKPGPRGPRKKHAATKA